MKEKLKEEQMELMRLYEFVESNPDEYGNFQILLDDLDDKADRIRWILEGGVN